MSKAFTKDDDDAGFVPPSTSALRVPAGHFRLTATGAARLEGGGDPGAGEVLARAEVLPPVGPSPERAVLGVTVRVQAEDGERSYRLVSPEEFVLVGDGCSVQSPLGRALLGAEPGDTRRVRTPGGLVELEVLGLEGE